MGKACEQRKKTDKVCSRRKRQKKHSMAEERKRKDNDMEKKRGKQKDIEKNEERKNGMDGGRYVRGGKFGMLPAGMALAMCTLAGCAVSEESGYFREGSYDPVKLEIYEAESGELQKTVEEEEMLYQFNQLFEPSVSRWLIFSHALSGYFIPSGQVPGFPVLLPRCSHLSIKLSGTDTGTYRNSYCRQPLLSAALPAPLYPLQIRHPPRQTPRPGS